ncbi:hypothetical protein UlMin_006194 [Ulmus minor]
MAELFIKQAKQYAETRPDYPKESFEFIASKTPDHDLAWDLAMIYKKVIATDTSPKQLEFAEKLPNIHYKQTPPTMSTTELEQKVTPKSTLDLITVATAYSSPLKPNGVIAAWCYTLPRVNHSVDAVLDQFYTVDTKPYWNPLIRLVEQEYWEIEFPFEALDGAQNTGPFEFVSERVMDLEEFLTFLRSWSAYETAKGKGVELLGNDVVEEFKRAWGDGGNENKKVVKFPLFLRIGKVGNVKI